MTQQIRYGEFVREVTINQRFVSYNDMTPPLKHDDQGEVLPHRHKRVRLRSIDIHRLLTPYVSVRLFEQLRAVLPLVAYLVLFQLLILKQSVTDSWVLTAGMIAVVLGLMLFMEGLKLGLMPFAEVIGNKLPQKSTLGVVLFIAFLLGIGVTFAEPAIGSLQAVGAIVNVERAPYLYALLNDWATTLVLMVGIGVGLAAVVGTLRLLYGWSLKPLIYGSLVPAIGITIFLSFDPELSKVLGLAWDSGAVTTGPVTVPLVLALGIGIAAAAGKGSSSLSGFGIVTIASLFPIIAVMSLAIFISTQISPEEIIAAAKSVVTSQATTPWYAQTPAVEIISGVRAIVPLVIFLFLVLHFIARDKLANIGIVFYGLLLCVVGMVVFNVGLSYGLANLGSQSGSLVPATFTKLEHVKNTPLYEQGLGVGIALFFAWALGFGATLAEPALNALGLTVENLTNGAFKRRLLIYAVSIGVGFGIALGVLKIIYDLPIAYFLIPGYGIAIILTALSTEEFVNIAWDSAGVTTGPVTVPLVLSMGLGFGNAVNAIEGFGILSMASICPILSVLTVGIWIDLQVKIRAKQRAQEEQEALQEMEGTSSWPHGKSPFSPMSP